MKILISRDAFYEDYCHYWKVCSMLYFCGKFICYKNRSWFASKIEFVVIKVVKIIMSIMSCFCEFMSIYNQHKYKYILFTINYRLFKLIHELLVQFWHLLHAFFQSSSPEPIRYQTMLYNQPFLSFLFL